jgi:hypothetical protein
MDGSARVFRFAAGASDASISTSLRFHKFWIEFFTFTVHASKPFVKKQKAWLFGHA